MTLTFKIMRSYKVNRRIKQQIIELVSHYYDFINVLLNFPNTLRLLF